MMEIQFTELMDYSDPKDSNSSIKLLNTSYTLDTSNIINRPSSFLLDFL